MDKLGYGEFWERKCRTYFSRLDLNDDGKLSKSDYEMLADRYQKLAKADELKAKQIIRRILNLWDRFHSKSAVNGAIDADEWIASLRRFPVFGLFRTVVEFMNMWFDMIDTNGDGVIQKEEYACFLKAFRVEDKAAVEASFKALDKDGDGKIDHDEFVDAGIEFWMCNDDALGSKLMFGPLIK